ncbi:MAG: S46 family peptidase [Candidatus Kapaibacterium sp.]
MNKKLYQLFLGLFVAFVFTLNTGFAQSTKSDIFDLGKMWTFEHAPIDYFEKTYGFKATQEWLEDVKLSAVRFGNGCSSSFISEDGLVMTNHHCGRGYVSTVMREGEDLSKTGFYAETLADERPVPTLWVDQLQKTIDVTKDIISAMDAGNTNEEKAKIKADKIKEIEAKYTAETGLKCNVITFYNGGMYMLYCYKRFNDVRLVFSPENFIAGFGGDPDNFTYPRYDFDCAFFRVYENGQPLKSKNFFTWSKNGAQDGETVFVIGNPGSTERLKTIAQLEFARDYTVPAGLYQLNFMADYLDNFIKNNPDKELRYQNTYYGVLNSQKVFKGLYKALKDNEMMARKKDFEDIQKAKIDASMEMKSKYGNIWNEIEAGSKDYAKIFNEITGYEVPNRFQSRYVAMAKTIVRNTFTGKQTPDSLLNAVYDNLDADYNKGLLELDMNIVYDNLGSDNAVVKSAFNNNNRMGAVKYVLDNSMLTNKEGATKLAKMSADELKSANDPIIKFIMDSKTTLEGLQAKKKEIDARLNINGQMLGQALFGLYGTSIPPDATLTLRIADGVIKSFDYNGTIAPPFTTFFGLYDRFYSHGKKFPWTLPERWQSPPSDFKLETEYNLVSTNDIIGGNSGSAMINKNAEVVGLVFDGNIESLPGRYIFTTEFNRTVSVDSRGLLEAIKNLYKANRLAFEMENGKMLK